MKQYTTHYDTSTQEQLDKAIEQINEQTSVYGNTILTMTTVTTPQHNSYLVVTYISNI